MLHRENLHTASPSFFGGAAASNLFDVFSSVKVPVLEGSRNAEYPPI
jgi:hypothetical protein